MIINFNDITIFIIAIIFIYFIYVYPRTALFSFFVFSFM